MNSNDNQINPNNYQLNSNGYQTNPNKYQINPIRYQISKSFKCNNDTPVFRRDNLLNIFQFDLTLKMEYDSHC